MKEQILQLKSEGKKNKEIAAITGCAESTVSYFCNGKYKQRSIANHRKRREAIKVKAINYKGGKCIVCKYDKCAAALDFHHLDPTKKESNSKSGLTQKTLDLEKLKPELDKCVLLCCRCHREFHAGLISL